ncbi:MAG: hypothetical protein F4X69_02645 [Gemmatimonadetes bacterium]|nr:hypothetical protein [Gemmatimonadota bacterium]
MRDLTGLLDDILLETRFEVIPYGTYTADQFRRFHIKGDLAGQYIVDTAKTCVPDALCARLVEKLALELQAFINPETQRIGTGLVSLMGGALDSAEPTITEFSRNLVRAAAMLGSAHAVQILQDWIAGEPYHFRMKVLLTGVQCDQPLALAEGMYVEQLPKGGYPADLTPHLPRSLIESTSGAYDFFGRSVLSIDGTARPALYRPTHAQDDQPDWNLQQVWAGGKIPCLMTDEWRQNLTEVLSIAYDQHVSWTHIWRDVGDIRAFHQSGGGYESRPFTQLGNAAINLEQQHLELARDLDVQRHARMENGRSPEIAISRWIRSKRHGTTLTDRFIDLRIAFESLYLPNKSRNELRFRLALFGAWHLGADFEERRQYFKLLKKTYDLGSVAVHTGHVDDTPETQKNLYDAQCACRKAILNRLRENEEPTWNEVDVALGAPTHVV